ncbi:hypothetical protein SAMN04515695_3704 [Pseudovibrio sp. Tun.PSC04-5.I4]|nr:hypothetical protein SAMN04515695_3704 [Pseudovibrio sp. Tun.PSC04-5.I4]
MAQSAGQLYALEVCYVEASPRALGGRCLVPVELLPVRDFDTYNFSAMHRAATCCLIVQLDVIAAFSEF